MRSESSEVIIEIIIWVIMYAVYLYKYYSIQFVVGMLRKYWNCIIMQTHKSRLHKYILGLKY